MVIPGTASTFRRHSGTQKSWITSRECTLNWTASPFGSTRRFVTIRFPPSFVAKVQANCWPTTFTTRVPRAGESWMSRSSTVE